MESGFVFGGKPYNAVGSNDADNVFDSSNVVANNDGSVLERLEYVTTVLAGAEPVSFAPSSAPTIDEDGGRAAVHVSIVDRNTGPIAAGNIDITAATYELAKSTAGGAFATAGITQPAGATKSAGQVDLEFDFDAAEWQVGDKYRLKLGGVTATVGSTTYYMGTIAWVGVVVEDLDVKAAVDDIDTDLGEPGDANTAATLHGRHKVPDADSNDNVLLRDVVGNKSDAGVQDHTDTTASIMALVRGAHEELGQNTEAATDPSAATGTLFSKLRGVGDDLDTVIAATDELEADVNTLRDAAIAAPTADTIEDQLFVAAGEPLRAFVAKTGGRAIAATKSIVDAVGHDGTTNHETGLAALLGADNNDNAFASTNVAANRDGSIIERLEHILSQVGVWTKDNYATVSCPASTETELVAEVTITKPTHVVAKVDVSNLTQDATVRVYHAMGAAGATLTAETARSFTVATDADVIPIDFWTDGNYEIRITTGAEGANRDVYVRHSRMVSE